MSHKKICFLISPIGTEDSDTRQQADDLLELIVLPAMQMFEFEIIRADRIPRPSVITSDIIQLVQTAELCIIDLTGSNPNVFYECGRRHETGKPFIQLINKKSGSLPFDVAGIRTILYDLSTPRAVNDAVKDIQKYIKEIVQSGFEEKSSGESLSSIAATLERIERKINQISLAPTTSLPSEGSDKEISLMEKLELQANPEKAYVVAFEAGDFPKLRATLPIIEKTFGATKKTILAALILANVGDSVGADVLERNLVLLSEKELADFEYQELFHAVGSLVKYYAARGEEKRGIKNAIPFIDKLLENDRFSSEQKAFFANQIQKLYFRGGNDEKALEYAKLTVELYPSEVIYLGNAALVCEKLGLKSQALEFIDKYMKLEAVAKNIEWIVYATQSYVENGECEKAKNAFELLSIQDINIANKLLKENKELKSVVM